MLRGENMKRIRVCYLYESYSFATVCTISNEKTNNLWLAKAREYAAAVPLRNMSDNYVKIGF